MIKDWFHEIGYRIRQFRQAVQTNSLTELEWAELTLLLSEAELMLFRQFQINDQRHSYQVMNRLKNGQDERSDLLVAALLHDIGKSSLSLSIVERVLIVVASWLFSIEQIEQWGEEEYKDSWKRPFVVKMQHPKWGAELAMNAGSTPTVVSLIRRHQDHLVKIETEEDQLLEQLQWADNQN